MTNIKYYGKVPANVTKGRGYTMKTTKKAALLLAMVLVGSAAMAPASALAREAKAAVIPAPTVQAVKVNLNQANLEQLESIKGIGPALAERIAAYRKDNGNFKSIEDLRNVRGIGQAKFDRIKDQIMI